jgi:hypothetical protein
MSNSQNISGPAPKDPLDAGKNAPTPDKFKKVMGVDSSEESDQRGARNRYVQQDEDEAEEEKEIASNPDIFSQLMSDKQTKEFSLGQSRDTTKEVESFDDSTQLSEDYQPPLDANDTDSIQIKSKIAPKFSEELSEKTPSDSPSITSEKAPSAKKHDAFKELEKIEKKLNTLHPGKNTTHPKSIEPHHEKKEEIEKKLENLHPGKNTTHPKSIEPHHEKKEEIEKKLENLHPVKNTTHPKPSQPNDEKKPELKERKGDEKEKMPIVSEEEKQLLSLPHEDLSVKIEQEQQPSAQAQPSIEPTTSTPLTASAPYTQFTPQLFELFQKLVGVMTVMQFQGKTTTSIILHMPKSALDGAHIDIEHYDTAPHAFNISLYTTPEGQKILDPQMQVLEQQLKNSMPNFQILVKKPLLLDESREEKKRRLTQVKKST